MVDALAPATRAFGKAVAEGASADDALRAGRRRRGRRRGDHPHAGAEGPGELSRAAQRRPRRSRRRLDRPHPRRPPGRRPGRAMTAASRYRGQPVSEGIGVGEIYHGDAPGAAGQDRELGRGRGAGRVRRGRQGPRRARRRAPRARPGPAGRDRRHRRADRGGPGPDRPGAWTRSGQAPTPRTRSARPARRRPRCWPRCPIPTWPSGRATSARWPRPRPTTLPAPPRRRRPREVHPGPPGGRPGRPDQAGRRRAGRRGVGRRRRQLARGDHRPRSRPAHAGRGRPGGTGRRDRAAGDPGRRGGRAGRRPGPPTEVAASRRASRRPDRTGQRRPAARAPREVRTADGQPVTLLCNVASAAETRLGLSGGAAGVGLLRTEIAFTRPRTGRPRPTTWHS